MSTLGNLVIRLEANIAKFTSDMGKAAHIAEQTMERIHKTSERAAEALKRLDERFIGIREAAKGLLAAVVAGGLVELFKSTLETTDQMGKMAQKTGVSVESLTRLSVAAKLADVDTQTLAKGMGKLSQSISQAASGMGIQTQAFQALGIHVRDAHGNLKNADTIMAEVADKFSRMRDGSGKTAAAMAIFGRAGADLIPMLNGGSEEMKKYADLADRLGITLDGKTSQAAQDVNDRFTTMGFALKGMAEQVMRNMLPTFDRFSRVLLDAATNGNTMKKMADALSTALKGIVSIGMGVVTVFETIGNAIGAIMAAVYMAIHHDFAGAKAALSNFASDTKAQLSGVATEMNKLWADSPVVHAKHIEAAHNRMRTLNFAQGGPTQAQDLSAQMSIMQAMGGTFDQQMRARVEQMHALSASARQLHQEYDRIAASEARANETAGKMHAARRLSDKVYYDTLHKITAEAERQRQAVTRLQEEQDRLNSSWEFGASKALQSYLDAATNTAQQSQKLFSDMFKGMEDALVNFAKTGKLNFTSLANSIINDLIRIAAQKAVAGMASSLFSGSSGGTSIFGSANGSAWINGVRAFAQGGIVNSPTLFPFANGTGLMGEAGPEAIMPLKRGADGKLGVAASGGAVGSGGAPVFQTYITIDQGGASNVKTHGSGHGKELADSFNRMANDWALREMRPGGLLDQAGVHAG